jgi:hypothetical protein
LNIKPNPIFFLTLEDGIDRLRLWLMDNSTSTEDALFTELRSIQTFASLRPADRIIIYLGAVFSEEVVSLGQILLHKGILAQLAPTQVLSLSLSLSFSLSFSFSYYIITLSHPDKILYFQLYSHLTLTLLHND